MIEFQERPLVAAGFARHGSPGNDYETTLHLVYVPGEFPLPQNGSRQSECGGRNY